MIVRVDATAALPVYEQIRQQVTRMAMAGTLPVGTRLPPIRQLASDLGIAKGTVAKAYEMLESSLVVESRGSKGTFVVELDGPAIPDVALLADAAQAYVVTARQSGVTLADAALAVQQAWASLGDAP